MRYPDEVPPGAELPFLNVHRYLAAAGVPVPAVYRSDPEANLLFLEDAGDTMLEDAVRDRGARGCLPLYEQCVEILVRIQSEGTRALDGKAIPARLAFDVAKFAEEIDFFFLHAVREYGGIPLSDREERAIGDLFLPFLERTVRLPARARPPGLPQPQRDGDRIREDPRPPEPAGPRLPGRPDGKRLLRPRLAAARLLRHACRRTRSRISATPGGTPPPRSCAAPRGTRAPSPGGSTWPRFSAT